MSKQTQLSIATIVHQIFEILLLVHCLAKSGTNAFRYSEICLENTHFFRLICLMHLKEKGICHLCNTLETDDILA